jgi:hypothetical protein
VDGVSDGVPEDVSEDALLAVGDAVVGGVRLAVVSTEERGAGSGVGLSCKRRAPRLLRE